MLIHTEVLSSKQPADGIVRGFLLLAVVFITAVCGYHFMFRANDVAIMMGKRHEIDAFCRLYSLRA